MMMPFDIQDDPERYGAFKRRKFEEYKIKCQRIIRGIEDVSLKQKDKQKLKKYYQNYY